jgi:hypothetical protein
MKFFVVDRILILSLILPIELNVLTKNEGQRQIDIIHSILLVNVHFGTKISDF